MELHIAATPSARFVDLTTWEDDLRKRQQLAVKVSKADASQKMACASITSRKEGLDQHSEEQWVTAC
jgi:hypothetical protein